MAKVDTDKLRKLGEVFDSPQLVAAADELEAARAVITALKKEQLELERAEVSQEWHMYAAAADELGKQVLAYDAATGRDANGL